LHNLQNDEITYQTIAAFCAEGHEEGLDLDYKSAWPKDLAPILCAMANVQGGIVLIGVATERGTRRPAWPPPGVDGTIDGLHQQAVAIAHDAIYPPLLPQVKVCPLEDDPSRAVVVIRVSASRLMHATDRRRRIYIRVADHSRPYDLADLSQLEWLYQQRDASIGLRRSLLQRAAARAANSLGYRDGSNKLYDGMLPSKLVAYVAPVYPNSHSVLAPPDLLKIARELGEKQSHYSHVMQLPEMNSWRTTTEGAYTHPYEGSRSGNQYLEVSNHGHVYVEQILHKWHPQKVDAEEIEVTSAYNLLVFAQSFMFFAASILRQLEVIGPIELSFTLCDVRGIVLEHREPRNRSIYRELHRNCFAQDNTIQLLQGEYSTNELTQRGILDDLGCNLMWAFGFPDSRTVLTEEYLVRLLGPA
jgi:hypothetical protein